MKIGLFSTFAGALPLLRTWLDHHRALGIERFYMFVDKPAEFEACVALDDKGVTWIARDEKLFEQWLLSPDWEYQQKFRHQVYSRQCLNADYAIRMARDEGLDWLLHMDLDEKLHVPAHWGDMKSYFASKAVFDQVRFTNHEGVPESWYIEDILKEVTLFKPNFAVLNDSQRELAGKLFNGRYFLAFYNGKAAMNMHGRATQSSGVHEFKPAHMIHYEHDVCVLHCTNCGFNWYYNKYATLGNYDDFWLDIAEIGKLFPIMEESRQAVVRGTIHDAARLYNEQLMHQGGLPYSKESLIKAGLLVRFNGEPTPQLI